MRQCLQVDVFAYDAINVNAFDEKGGSGFAACLRRHAKKKRLELMLI